MADKQESHYFHAEAHALAGQLVLPFKEEIKKQAFVKLEGELERLSEEERAQRNYFSQHAKNFRLESIISYAAAHTQVSGHVSKKHSKASVTLATSEVIDLNVLNVITADRVVAQISTTHFPDERAPSVTFLGTHFENLRIARHRTEPYLKLDLVGERPAGDKAMHVDQGTSFMKAVEGQYQRLKAGVENLGADLRTKIGLTNSDSALAKKYHGLDLNYASIKAQADKANEPEGRSWDGITCSLVENVEIKDISVKAADGKAVLIPPPAKSFGHVIHIPDFGTIYLAELTVNHNSFNLTMIRLDLGCIADGNVCMSTANVNGKGKPPGP
jgi:hypothetical protein